ncbi:hypothetical protein EYF80_047204 [Liparis tanakae]|uniref:Uncharacterized protein n=1 Tax=Liparis tanakae TaxID=230148 RepID=A0A4Z2FMZ7_9TELE|nr:hypothetical protein EYF80_047204 [Liparis tanakae]
MELIDTRGRLSEGPARWSHSKGAKTTTRINFKYDHVQAVGQGSLCGGGAELPYRTFPLFDGRRGSSFRRRATERTAVAFSIAVAETAGCGHVHLSLRREEHVTGRKQFYFARNISSSGDTPVYQDAALGQEDPERLAEALTAAPPLPSAHPPLHSAHPLFSLPAGRTLHFQTESARTLTFNHFFPSARLEMKEFESSTL